MTVRLSKLEAQALTAWRDTCPEFNAISFSAVASRSGLPSHQVRRVVRALARKGMTEYMRATWTDDGEFMGAAYGITDAGRRALSEGDRHD